MSGQPAHGHDSDLVPHEKPEDWGWNADLGKLARVGGVFSLIGLALLLTATRYNNAGTVFIVVFMLLIVVGLIWDARQRKTSWRK